jgi:hypothetical protein
MATRKSIGRCGISTKHIFEGDVISQDLEAGTVLLAECCSEDLPALPVLTPDDRVKDLKRKAEILLIDTPHDTDTLVKAIARLVAFEVSTDRKFSDLHWVETFNLLT